MNSEEIWAKCTSCDEKFIISRARTTERGCPNCGQDLILCESVGGGAVGISSSLRGVQKDLMGFVRKTVKSLWKRAGRTGRRAKEEIVIDRTSDTETIKTHQVWEINEEGQLVKEHDEKETLSAKHRPRTK